MNTKPHSARAAAASEIREIVGALDDGTLLRVAAIGATREELLEAWTWLGSDDYLQRAHHHMLSGRAAAVVNVLEGDRLERDRR